MIKLNKKTKNVLKNILNFLGLYDKKKFEGLEYDDEVHPERLVLLPYCEMGKGIDVGCGHRKTHPNSIGIDLIPQGTKGQIGCVKNEISNCDICSSGDKLDMFADEELDFVIARHNLEHYVDLIKTLKEWKRVLKKNGILAIVFPDEVGLNKRGFRGIELDSTHEHSFSMESIKE